MQKLLVACIVAMLAGAASAGDTAAADLKAGVASVDLTPPAEMKAALGGYGERMSRPAEGVHDQVHAKALMLTDGTRRFAVVTADVLAFPPPVKPAVVKRLATQGVACDGLILLPSHSHTSIDMSAIHPGNIFGIPQIGVYQPELYEFVVQRLADVVRDAGSDLVPVKLGVACGEIDGWNRNRREKDGPTDSTLTVARFDAIDGRPLAVLVHFAAHPTFMQAEHMLFSAGWPGHLQRKLESLIGEEVVALYANGAQGDVAPVGRPNSGPDRWEVAERYGAELALEAHGLWRKALPREDGPFDFHAHTIKLPDRIWHRDFSETGGEEYSLTEQLLTKMLPVLFPSQVDVVSLRLGDLLIVGVPGEMTTRLGLRLKAEAAKIAGVPHVAVGGLADAWISYILSEEEYRAGGYEASVSFYGPALGNVIIDGVLEGVGELTASRETASK